MLLQTNSYVVPKEKRAEHARLIRRFRQALAKLGCDQFEVYEQVGSNWTSDQSSGRFVQIMRFRDRRHQLGVQAAERDDPVCQAIIAEFCELINFPYQQQQGLFALGYYTSILAAARALPQAAGPQPPETASAPAGAVTPPAPPVVPPLAPLTALIGELNPEHSDDIHSEPPPVPPALLVMPFADGPPVSGLHPIDLDSLPAAETLASNTGTLVPGPIGPGVEETSAPDVELVLESVGSAQDETTTEAPEHAAGKNGDSEQSSAETAPQAQAPSLDELIKQRFGPLQADQAIKENSNGEPAPPASTGSGIGAVLDASLGDDPELDVVLPAELLDLPAEQASHGHGAGPHDSGPSHDKDQPEAQR